MTNRISEIRIQYFVQDADGIIKENEDTKNITFAPTEEGEYVIQWEFKGLRVAKIIPKESVLGITIIYANEEDK